MQATKAQTQAHESQGIADANIDTYISVHPLVDVLGVFTPRNHARTSKNGSAGVPRLPQIPEDVPGKTSDVPMF